MTQKDQKDLWKPFGAGLSIELFRVVFSRNNSTRRSAEFSGRKHPTPGGLPWSQAENARKPTIHE
jgi:hypothetical protein